MKKLIVICGANGVGKSSASNKLLELLPNSAYIDSDWCRKINPFGFSDETVDVVKKNILSIMINYFDCPLVQNVIFSYGFHGRRKEIYESIICELRKEIDFELHPVILFCSEDENVSRMQNDNRDEARIKRGLINTRSIYDEFEYPKIDVTNLSIKDTAVEIISILKAKSRTY